MEKTPRNEVTITKVTVKKPEDLKNFAETTMNELLGWYGYQSPPGKEPIKLPRKCRSISESNESEGESLKFTEGCGWCGKTVDESSSVISATAVFCSELCFSQSRRATFKRNKTCDWCRNARHTVSYVDFQDNASQLQFCSDKCVNQYKMHIFCRETQAHLELHPHLPGLDATTGAGLITPDLWLKNCSSPKAKICSPAVSPKPAADSSSSQTTPKLEAALLQEPLPLISVAPSSKLLATDNKRHRQRNSRRIKRGCPSTVTSLSVTPPFSDIPQDLRVRQTPPLEETAKFNLEENSKDEFKPLRIDTEDASSTKCEINNFRAILGNILPPPTTFIPYPVILPLPIPIPIPIPIPKMFKSDNGKDLIELKDNTTQTDDVMLHSINNNEDDFEKNEAKDHSEVLNVNKRLLRKRKHVNAKPKVFSKHKKTVSTIP